MIFDGNRRLSPFAIIIWTFGIFLAVASPPLGVLILLLGFIRQRCFRGKINRTQRALEAEALAKAREKQRRDRILALKAFP